MVREFRRTKSLLLKPYIYTRQFINLIINPVTKTKYENPITKTKYEFYTKFRTHNFKL